MRLDSTPPSTERLSTVPCSLCGATDHARAWMLPPRETRARELGLPGGRSQWAVCRGCGFVYQNPRPSDLALAKMYAAGGYHRYASGVPEHYVKYSLRRPVAALAWAQEQLGSGAGGRAIDIGCGVGGAMIELERLGWDVVGVEPDPDLSQLARARFGLDVRTGFFDAHTFDDGEKFDLVYASHVWEHLSDPSATTKAVRASLRGEGHFMIVVPTFRRARRMAWGTFSAAHNFMYSESTLGQLLRSVGFDVVAHRFAAGADSELWMLARAARAPASFTPTPPSMVTIQAQLVTVPLRAPLGLPLRMRTHLRTLRSDPKDFFDRLRRWTTGRIRRISAKLRP